MKLKSLALQVVFLIGTNFATLLFTYAQVNENTNFTDQRITIEVNDIKLKDLLHHLQKDMDIPVVYAIDNIPANNQISIMASDMLLADFFDELCQQAEITWTQINGFFVIKNRRQPDHVNTTLQSDDSLQDYIPIEKVKVNGIKMKKNVAIQKDDRFNNKHISAKKLPVRKIMNNPSLQVPYHQGSDLAHKKTQNKGIKIKDITAFYSFDIHKFYFKPGLTDDQYYRSDWNHSIGVTSTYQFPIDGLSITSGILYSTKNFKYYFNYKVLDIQDPIPIPDIMSVEISYLELPVKFNYQLIQYHLIACKISLGYHAAFSIVERETTSYQNADDQDTNSCISSTRSFLEGISIGTLFTCPITSDLDLSLEPRFIQYFHPVNTNTMNAATHLIRVNVGIKYTFKSIK